MATPFGTSPLGTPRLAIDIIAYGSRGDLEPMIALATQLRAAGHRPRIFCAPDDIARVVSTDLPALAVGQSVRAHFASRFSMRNPRRLAAFVDFLAAQIGPMAATLSRTLDADLVLATGVAWGAPIAAARLALPYHFVALSPAVLPSGGHGPPIFPQFRFPPRVQRALWRGATLLVDSRLGPAFRRACREAGLDISRTTSQVSRIHEFLLGPRVLVASDPALGPLPSDLAVPALQIGFRTPRVHLPLPAAVESFLAAGPPPLYVGLGSMNHPDPVGLARVLAATAHEAGLRVIIQRGWAGLDPASPHPETLVVDELSHAALFPRVAAVFHHGGAGTTATAARAGVPQIIWPQFLDQYYWARQVAALGLGVSLPWRLVPNTARAALVAASDTATRGRARALSAVLRDADATDTAVARIAELAA